MEKKTLIKISIAFFLISLIPCAYGVYLNLNGKESFIAIPFALLSVGLAYYFNFLAEKKKV